MFLKESLFRYCVSREPSASVCQWLFFRFWVSGFVCHLKPSSKFCWQFLVVIQFHLCAAFFHLNWINFHADLSSWFHGLPAPWSIGMLYLFVTNHVFLPSFFWKVGRMSNLFYEKKKRLSFCGLFANDSVLGDNHSLEELVMTDFRPFHIFLPDCVTKERDCMLGLDVWTDLPLLVGKLLGNQVS